MRPSRSALRSAALTILGAVVMVNALWRGGVRWPAQAGSALACAVAMWLAVQRGRGSPEAGEGARKTLPWLVVGLALATLLVGLQLVPLPPALLETVAPAAAALQQEVLGPLGQYPAWRPLSLDPGATAVELAKMATWTMAAAAAALVSGTTERRERLLSAVALAGAAVAAVCYGAALAGVGRLAESSATFLNPNHLSSFLLLSSWIALGFGLRARGPERVAWLAAFVAMASQVFLSLSRSGIAAFFVGAGVSTVLAIRSGHAARALERLSGGRPGQAWRAFAAPVAVFSTLAVSAWLALDRVVGELRTLSEVTSDVKLSLWPLGWQALVQYPLLGTGRGAFATVFAAYKVEMAQVTFTHLENTWLQIPLDLGVPAGLALIGLLAWSWLTAARGADLSRPMIGALSGLVAVAAHDVFDFSLELNGVAIPFLVLLAVGARAGPGVHAPRWLLRAGAAAGLALAAAGLAVGLTRDADRQVALITGAEGADEARAAAVDALAWHPADWVPPAIVGAKLVDEGRCFEAMPWLNRAMLRNPTAPEPHRQSARCLAAAGQDEVAKREFRLAFVYGDSGALREALDAFPAPLALLDVAPDTPAGLLAAGALLRERPEEAAEAYRRAWESFHLPAALSGLARATLALDDAEQALELAQRLQVEAPTDPAGFLVAAEALVKLEQEGEAVRVLEDGVSRLPKRAELLFALGNRHLAARRFSQAKLVFERVVAREGPEVAQKRLAIARALEAQGRFSEALKEARAACDSYPGQAGPLLATSRIAARASLYDVAIDAMERAAKLPSALPGAYDEQLGTLRAAKASHHARWMEKQEQQAPAGAP